MIVELVQPTLAKEIGQGVTIVDFWATWCQPCKAINAELERLVQMRPGVKVVKVNVDKHPGLVAEYQVKSVPTVLVFNGSLTPASLPGVTRAEEIIRKFSL